jgi:hypothetical protein
VLPLARHALTIALPGAWPKYLLLTLFMEILQNA